MGKSRPRRSNIAESVRFHEVDVDNREGGGDDSDEDDFFLFWSTPTTCWHGSTVHVRLDAVLEFLRQYSGS